MQLNYNQSQAPFPKPLLRWAGGKQRLIPHLLGACPPDLDNLVSFLGAGSLFFALQPKRAILGDANKALIEVHRTYIGTVERGEVNLTLENIEKLALGLNLAVWELMKEAEKE
jgi:site-specific DNA-adenine methylase